MNRNPLPKKRLTPRRNEGRISQGRMKERRVEPTADERRHIERVAAMPCLVSGEAATVHHVTASIYGGRMSRSHQRIVPLAPRFHQKVHDPKASDPISVEGLAHSGFYRKYGINLLAVAEQLWRESDGSFGEPF